MLRLCICGPIKSGYSDFIWFSGRHFSEGIESIGKISEATNWIFSNPDAANSSDMDATTSSTPTADVGLPDGGGRYRLIGLVSHIGTSTQCGHYVAHIYKDGRWVIFNDDKVGASINPPKDMGYLYFFERLSS
ncbi:unnamed protein product, partial [Vitis vinifera]|uniref:USP domain-containing protein n=1 Tax=Vitis vinifera TaxID=29760 RepID=E0CSU7_VITVI